MEICTRSLRTSDDIVTYNEHHGNVTTLNKIFSKFIKTKRFILCGNGITHKLKIMVNKFVLIKKKKIQNIQFST